MWAVGRVVEYPVYPVGLGDERGVAEGVAESYAEPGDAAGLVVGSGYDGEGHQKRGEGAQQQQTTQLATGSLYHRGLAVQPEYAQDEYRKKYACKM